MIAFDRVFTTLRGLRPRARLAIGLGLAGTLAALVVYFSLPPATLKVVCRHSFRTAELTVSVDGALVHTDTLKGTVSRKFFGVVEKTGGTYTTEIRVAPGTHVVTVGLHAPGYDYSSSIGGDFRRGEAATLSADARDGLYLAWRDEELPAKDAPVAGAPSRLQAPAWLAYAGTMLMALAGAIVSATIGVFVQDFIRAWRERRAQATMTEGPPAAPRS